MGTDISIYPEIQNKGLSDQWYPINYSGEPISMYRDYTMFGILAGVRNTPDDGSPKTAFRSIPKNVSSSVRDIFKDRFYHSTTWMSYTEYCEAILRYENDCKYNDVTYYALKGMLEPYVQRGYNVRLIIGFDC